MRCTRTLLPTTWNGYQFSCAGVGIEVSEVGSRHRAGVLVLFVCDAVCSDVLMCSCDVRVCSGVFLCVLVCFCDVLVMFL